MILRTQWRIPKYIRAYSEILEPPLVLESLSAALRGIAFTADLLERGPIMSDLIDAQTGWNLPQIRLSRYIAHLVLHFSILLPSF